MTQVTTQAWNEYIVDSFSVDGCTRSDSAARLGMACGSSRLEYLHTSLTAGPVESTDFGSPPDGQAPRPALNERMYDLRLTPFRR